MNRPVIVQRTVFDALAEEILHNYGHGRVLVAVDGLDPEITRMFAAGLIERLRRRDHPAFEAHIDDFRLSRAKRAETSGRPEDAYDLSAFRRVLVEPFRLAGSTGFVTAHFDARRDQPIEPKWLTADADAIVVVDGPFLLRPETRGLFSYTVWLDAPAAVDEAAAKRYLKSSKPAELANAVYDLGDPAHPVRMYGDSC